MAAKKKKVVKTAPKKAPAKAAKAVKTLKTAKKPAAPKRSAKAAPSKAPAKKGARARTPQPAIIHWEIQAQDAKKVQRFYADLFGWAIDASNPMEYGMVESRGKEGINGGIGGSPGGRSRLLVYATVDDINDVLEKAEALGAKTILPRTDVGPVIMGIFEDVEGNHFGLVEGGME